MAQSSTQILSDCNSLCKQSGQKAHRQHQGVPVAIWHLSRTSYREALVLYPLNSVQVHNEKVSEY